ncbi:MAG: type VI secretion system tip protein TssI/VgrG [Polyangiaceae bacterium]
MCTFEVQAGPLSSIPWAVASITGREAINELYGFTATVVAPRAAIDAAGGQAEQVLLRERVTLRLTAGGPLRHAIVAAASAEAPRGDDTAEEMLRYRLELRPRAWLMHHRRNSRIFQNLYVHNIVSTILHENGLNHRWDLELLYPKRLYCTQYEETDYEFVTRLLAEEGIYFYFDHLDTFDGGPVPKPDKKAENDFTKAGEITKTVSEVVGGMAGMFGSEAKGYVELGAKFGEMTGDLLIHEGEEEEPIPLGSGTAGPGGAGEVFVFSDHVGGYLPIGDLTLEHADLSDFSAGDELRIFAIGPRHQTATERVEIRDFDFDKPLLLHKARAATSPEGDDPPVTEEAYAHHGEYNRPDVDPEMAGVHLAQARAGASLIQGRAISSAMWPGRRFTLENARPSAVPDGDYVLTEVSHECHSPELVADTDAVARGVARALAEALHSQAPPSEEELRALVGEATSSDTAALTYQNRFRGLDALLPARPPRPKRIMKNVTETAIVVGPEGDEIHVDKYGRVRVQFHWDRQGTYDQKSSAWIRVMQTWAGAGFGFQFFPRVGMEVLVTFLGGDPDRPVIVGALYNGTHVTPEPLPASKTMSVLRTQSSPGGGGFNQLLFEDKKGGERISVHAERDFDQVVNNHHFLDVKNSQRTTIQATQQIDVGETLLTAVGHNHDTIIGENQSSFVQGNRVASVHRHETALVDGDQLLGVDGVAVQQVKADQMTVVQGDRSLDVHGNFIVTVGSGAQASGNAVTFVEGNVFTTATKQIVLRADAGDAGGETEIRIENGNSVIRLLPDRIVIASENVEIRGGDSVHLHGAESNLTLDGNGAALVGDPVNVCTPSGARLRCEGRRSRLCGPEEARVEGGQVQLGQCPPAQGDESDDDESPDTGPEITLKFTHLELEGNLPLANVRYRVLVDGNTYEGNTNGDGELRVFLDEDSEVLHVTLWAYERHSDLYPREDGPLTWLVHLVDDFEAASDIRGARARLRNLGYTPHTSLAPPAEEDLDPRDEQAILEFQIDARIERTKKLDQETKKQIDDLYECRPPSDDENESSTSSTPSSSGEPT